MVGFHTCPLLGPTIKPERAVFSAAIFDVVGDVVVGFCREGTFFAQRGRLN